MAGLFFICHTFQSIGNYTSIPRAALPHDPVSGLRTNLNTLVCWHNISNHNQWFDGLTMNDRWVLIANRVAIQIVLKINNTTARPELRRRVRLNHGSVETHCLIRE